MNKDKILELIRYIIIGFLTTFVNYIVYKLTTLSTIESTSIAWFVSVLFAYIFNKIFVFKSKNKNNLIKEITKFFICRLSSGLFDIIIMFSFVDVLNINEDIVKIFSNIIIIIINYILSKHLIFAHKK